jgi:hypothetical protein
MTAFCDGLTKHCHEKQYSSTEKSAVTFEVLRIKHQAGK